MLKTIYIIFFGLLLFILPFTISAELWSASSLVGGQFSVWATFFVYIQDILLLILFGLSLQMFFKHKILHFHLPPLSLLFFLGFGLFNLFFVEDAILQFFNILRLFVLFTVLSVLPSLKLSMQTMYKVFLSSMLFVSGIAIVQFYLQHSLGFSFLGEPEIGKDILGVAKIITENDVIVRAYGTFLHPNILAFFSAISFFIAHKYHWNKLKWLFVIPLFLSFSRSVWFAFTLVTLWMYRKTILSYTKTSALPYIIGTVFVFLILTFIFFDLILARTHIFDAALFERLAGIGSSLQMLIHYSFGVGAQQFTLFVSQFSSTLLYPWNMQPVHNTPLLIINEWGVFAVTALAIFFIQQFKKVSEMKKNILVFILICSLFDHYLWTNFSAQILLFLFLFKN